jgi:hypothetical protein
MQEPEGDTSAGLAHPVANADAEAVGRMIVTRASHGVLSVMKAVPTPRQRHRRRRAHQCD